MPPTQELVAHLKPLTGLLTIYSGTNTYYDAWNKKSEGAHPLIYPCVTGDPMDAEPNRAHHPQGVSRVEGEVQCEGIPLSYSAFYGIYNFSTILLCTSICSAVQVCDVSDLC